ncbi:MAG: PEP-CTERM sorting domain-containing protein [Planctomycetaceae bacterium]
MRFAKIAAAMVAMAVCGVVNANPLYFQGSALTANLPTAVGGSFVLSNLAYTASAGQNAAVNSAVFALSMAGAPTANFTDIKGGLGASKNRLRVQNLNTLLVNVNWSGDVGATIGTSTSELNLTIVSTKNIASNVASQANIDFLIANANSITGAFFANGQGSLPDTDFELVGTLNAVPEPSTWGLLAGIGMVVGRRYLRRRNTADSKA